MTKYLLTKLEDYEKSGTHEYSEWNIAEDWNGKPGDYIASLVPCHKGSEELAIDAADIVRRLNEHDELLAALETLKGAFETNVRDCEAWIQYRKARAIIAKVKGA